MSSNPVSSSKLFTVNVLFVSYGGSKYIKSNLIVVVNFKISVLKYDTLPFTTVCSALNCSVLVIKPSCISEGSDSSHAFADISF